MCNNGKYTMQNFQGSSHIMCPKTVYYAISIQSNRLSFAQAPFSTYPYIFENGDFVSVLAVRPHVNCVLGHEKRTRFSKTVPRVEFFKIAGLRLVFTSDGVGVGVVSEVVRALIKHHNNNNNNNKYLYSADTF